ncbi:hypothetical protein [Leptospira noguchii]|nr:hypothetical protein [Leptospira noguchii]
MSFSIAVIICLAISRIFNPFKNFTKFIGIAIGISILYLSIFKLSSYSKGTGSLFVSVPGKVVREESVADSGYEKIKTEIEYSDYEDVIYLFSKTTLLEARRKIVLEDYVNGIEDGYIEKFGGELILKQKIDINKMPAIEVVHKINEINQIKTLAFSLYDASYSISVIGSNEKLESEQVKKFFNSIERK